jgi:hypothetical protein
MPANTVKVDRSTPFGNPWRVGEHGVPTAAEAVRMFRVRLIGPFALRCDPRSRLGWIQAHVHELRGQNLGCWCALEDPCHADTLLELANPPVLRSSVRSEGG